MTKKKTPKKKATRSAHLGFVTTPAIRDRIAQKASAEGRPVSTFIHRLIEKHL